jgi:hypothetical protein
MNTLFLMPESWDIALDVHGNIALARNAYAMAQDVASAIRLFDGELWYDTSKGVPHFDQALGRIPSLALYKNSLVSAAKTVPGVIQARPQLEIGNKRVLGGSIIFTDSDNIEWAVNL